MVARLTDRVGSEEDEPTPKKVPATFAKRAEVLLVPPPRATPTGAGSAAPSKKTTPPPTKPLFTLRVPPVASSSKRRASEEVEPSTEAHPAKRPRVSQEGIWDRFQHLEETMIAWRSHVEKEVQHLNQKTLDLAKQVGDGNVAMDKARAELAKAIRELEKQGREE